MIISIDPGTTESAVVFWDGKRVVHADIMQNEDCIGKLAIASKDHAMATLCIEMIASYGMPVGKEVFETCVFIGRMFQLWLYHTGQAVSLIYRRDVKLHHCGSARAKDGNIRQALIDKYGAPGTKKAPGRTYGLKSHLWQAFAIATYVHETKILPDNPAAAFSTTEGMPK